MNLEELHPSHLKVFKTGKPVSFEIESQNESKTWEDFLKGSDSALAYFYRTYSAKLYNYGRQIINDDDTVNDSIQDLFFELINKRRKLGKTTSVKNYLYASLRRRLIRIKEKSLKHISEESNEGRFQISFLKDDQTPLDQFSTEQMRLLENACNELPERQREAIILLYFEELDYEEVAKIMDIGKVRSARALIYRAIDSLKAILTPLKGEFISLLILMSLH